jgi:hypothetical protein
MEFEVLFEVVEASITLGKSVSVSHAVRTRTYRCLCGRGSKGCHDRQQSVAMFLRIDRIYLQVDQRHEWNEMPVKLAEQLLRSMFIVALQLHFPRRHVNDRFVSNFLLNHDPAGKECKVVLRIWRSTWDLDKVSSRKHAFSYTPYSKDRQSACHYTLDLGFSKCMESDRSSRRSGTYQWRLALFDYMLRG